MCAHNRSLAAAIRSVLLVAILSLLLVVSPALAADAPPKLDDAWMGQALLAELDQAAASGKPFKTVEDVLNVIFKKD